LIACIGSWGTYQLGTINNPADRAAVAEATSGVVELWERSGHATTWVEVDSAAIALPSLSGGTVDLPTVMVPDLQAVFPVPS
jgi:hypothetical protein